MAEKLSLRCPIRGRLKATGKSRDGLSPTEESYRIAAIRNLLDKGYPSKNFVIEPVVQRLGNSGRNSVRADFAILDMPAADVGRSTDAVLEHAVVLGEVKRDNADAPGAMDFQVQPLLAFARRTDCVAVYWDDVEQVVLHREVTADKVKVRRAPLATLGSFGASGSTQHELTLIKLRRDAPLREVFKRIEDVLHASNLGPSKRFSVMMQLLLAKIYDEHNAESSSGGLTIQDFGSLDLSYEHSKQRFEDLLSEAADYYKRHLPDPVSKKFDVPRSAFFETFAILAPHMITAASHSVIQDFYMYFAKGVYKWDLAQHFTPPPITDFIVDLIAPRWSEDVLDPACGSADFLAAAFRRGQGRAFRDYASRVHGFDVSPEAVQVAVLNMVLNGDGKSNIFQLDSLLDVRRQEGKWGVLICNPPFGSKIVERRKDVLSLFNMGVEGYSLPAKSRDAKTFKTQEVGILFSELCVRLAKHDTGRVALILPNGYLGNTSEKFVEFRRWILKNTRVAGVIGLPRFTFKSSGADVSASIVLLEKRAAPLKTEFDGDPYDVAFEVVNNVGWVAGTKRTVPQYVRDMSDGSLEVDESLNPVVEADYEAIREAITGSTSVEDFPWLCGAEDSATPDAAGLQPSVSVEEVLQDPYLTLDPKRFSKKYRATCESLLSVPNFRLGDVIEVAPEATVREYRTAVKPDGEYSYVEIAGVESGAYSPEHLRGWQLPSRARHIAAAGDIYVGGLWSSVRKWCVIGEEAEGVLVTNGMHRLRLRPGVNPDIRLDIVAGLCSEAYRVQMRALARGSDGLAEIRGEDVKNVILPLVDSPEARAQLAPFVNRLFEGVTGIASVVRSLEAGRKLPVPPLPERTSHVQLV